jgi:hypothetical protein
MCVDNHSPTHPMWVKFRFSEYKEKLTRQPGKCLFTPLTNSSFHNPELFPDLPSKTS